MCNRSVMWMCLAVTLAMLLSMPNENGSCGYRHHHCHKHHKMCSEAETTTRPSPTTAMPTKKCNESRCVSASEVFCRCLVGKDLVEENVPGNGSCASMACQQAGIDCHCKSDKEDDCFCDQTPPGRCPLGCIYRSKQSCVCKFGPAGVELDFTPPHSGNCSELLQEIGTNGGMNACYSYKSKCECKKAECVCDEKSEVPEPSAT